MTPGARIAAAIEILDSIVEGRAAEAVLTRWARSSRFAGSGDRAAVRDYVYDALRHWRSDAVRGGGTSGRARMIGRLRAEGTGIEALFSGVGHAPDPLSTEEMQVGQAPETTGDVWDLPDWLVDVFRSNLGDDAEATALELTRRAPVTLRVNTARTDRETVQGQLRSEGVETIINPRAATALTVTEGPRRLRNASSYLTGLVEIQDASSQAAVLSISGTGRALDYCAGGGGKALALAALGWDVTAHDIDEGRMRDVPVRATRAGRDIAQCLPQDIGEAGFFDLVLCDAPCSGAGTWRRAPEAKWALTPERLDALTALQAQVLDAAAVHVGPKGQLVYATCSVLPRENMEQIDKFLARHPDWRLTQSKSWAVDSWGDGFFAAALSRS